MGRGKNDWSSKKYDWQALVNSLTFFPACRHVKSVKSTDSNFLMDKGLSYVDFCVKNSIVEIMKSNLEPYSSWSSTTGNLLCYEQGVRKHNNDEEERKGAWGHVCIILLTVLTGSYKNTVMHRLSCRNKQKGGWTRGKLSKRGRTKKESK